MSKMKVGSHFCDITGNVIKWHHNKTSPLPNDVITIHKPWLPHSFHRSGVGPNQNISCPPSLARIINGGCDAAITQGDSRESQSKLPLYLFRLLKIYKCLDEPIS